MFRKSYLWVFCIALLMVVSLIASSSDVSAGEKGTGLRSTTDILSECYVPYNINVAGFATGIHIVTTSTKSEEMTILFFHGSKFYAKNIVTIPPEGWTGLVTDLLPPGVRFQSPTFMYIINYDDQSSGWSGKFLVTQFLFTGYGFSHQIIYSF